MKIFREMDCAGRNQQGNGDVAEIFCPNMFFIFIALWLLYAIPYLSGYKTGVLSLQNDFK